MRLQETTCKRREDGEIVSEATEMSEMKYCRWEINSQKCELEKAQYHEPTEKIEKPCANREPLLRYHHKLPLYPSDTSCMKGCVRVGVQQSQTTS